MGRLCRLTLPFATRGLGPGSNAPQASPLTVNSVDFSRSNVVTNSCSSSSNTCSNNLPKLEPNSCLKCMYTNADSLRNKMSELKTLVWSKKPHIIAITEAKPKHCRDLCVEDFVLEGYNFYHTNIDKALGRGIVLFVQNFSNITVKT